MIFIRYLCRKIRLKMRRTAIILMVLLAMTAQAIDLTKATIVYHKNDHPLVAHMAGLMADDIERVSGVRPKVTAESELPRAAMPVD